MLWETLVLYSRSATAHLFYIYMKGKERWLHHAYKSTEYITCVRNIHRSGRVHRIRISDISKPAIKTETWLFLLKNRRWLDRSIGSNQMVSDQRDFRHINVLDEFYKVDSSDYCCGSRKGPQMAQTVLDGRKGKWWATFCVLMHELCRFKHGNIDSEITIQSIPSRC